MTNNKFDKRVRRSVKTRANIARNEKIRLSVYRSSKHIFAQIIDDGFVLAAASTLDKEINLEGHTGNVAAAEKVGALIAERAMKAGLSEGIAFDRSGFKYHGRVKALAESARRAGLKF